jgi:cytoskeletal protein CcmA (bactofilin family)
MFGSDKKNQPPRPATSIECLIGGRMTIKGDVTFSGGLVIDGVIKGTLNAESADASVLVSDKGTVEGEMRAPHISINGSVVGDVHATEKLELGVNARVRGNVYYKLLEMAAGAQINGQMFHEDEPRKQLAPPEQTSS